MSRIKLEGTDGNDVEGPLRAMEHCFNLLNERIFPEEMRTQLEAPKDAAKLIVYFYCTSIIQIQKIIGSPVSIFKYNALRDGIHWDMFLEYEFENPGRRAVAFAFGLIQHITENCVQSCNTEELLEYLEKQISKQKAGYVASTPKLEVRSILLAAEKRNIPWRQLPGSWQYYQYGYGKYQNILCETLIDVEGHNAVKITDDKALTSTMLSEMGLPVARFSRVKTKEQAKEFSNKVGYPVVVKPLVGMQGTGVTPNIKNALDLEVAYAHASKYHSSVLIEKHTVGDDYRLLVFGGKFVGAIKRSITIIEGDGKRSISTIIEEINSQPWRNRSFGNPKYQVRKIPAIEECLKLQGYDWNSVPDAGSKISLHVVPNISQGGTVETIWKDVHPANIVMAERAAKTVGVKLAGVDYITDDITKPYWETGGTICEVNAKPAYDLMFEGMDKYRNELGKLAFEISCPPNANMSLPVIVVVSKNEKLGLEIKDAIKKDELTVGYFSPNQTMIGEVVLDRASGSGTNVGSVLWNSAVDAVIIHESEKRIQRKGLEYNIFSHLVIEEMPLVNGRPEPKILSVLLDIVTHTILINKDNMEVLKWAKSVSSNKISFAKKENLQMQLLKGLSTDFPEQFSNITKKLVEV